MSLENILGLDKKLGMKFKQLFILLKMGFKLTLKIIYLVRERNEKQFWLNGDELKSCSPLILWKNRSQK